MAGYPSPISFSTISNVTSCQPFTFTFSYVDADTSFTGANTTSNNLTAWVDHLSVDGEPVMQRTLARNAALNSSFTSLSWDPVTANPGNYSINARVSSDSDITFEPTTTRFSIQAGPDESCLNPVTQTSVVPTSTAVAVSSGLSVNHGLKTGVAVGITLLFLIIFAIIGLFFARRRSRLRKAGELPSYTASVGGVQRTAEAEKKELESKMDRAPLDSDAVSVQMPPPPYINGRGNVAPQV
ncbi:hypothetical protein BD410DRAFT_789158 [Rickenella mellea]|uniref:Uncharacterized protein n=1 Tax=Rickenella mellea TaxID=50990 RepID=A0A4Y7Q349_9AGAM|nr:hypothetical protein BD410DRAFT_789158 [Rickenella mellea]